MVHSKAVVLIGSLDTKSDEIAFLRDKIKAEGHETITMDVGILGEALTKADISREEVAARGGSTLRELVENARKGIDKAFAVKVMTEGASQIVAKLFCEGRVAAVVAVGGAIGTAIGTAAMKRLPNGVPKVMISIVLSSRMKQYVDSKDIIFVNYPTDLLGLNFLTRKVLSNASGAVSGMLRMKEPERNGKKLVAITSLGVTTPAVMKAKEKLEREGFETIVYTIDTEGLDELLEKGLISAVLDLTPCELVNIYLTNTSQHHTRMALANERGIPQVIAPGGLDFIILPFSINDVPESYQKRHLYEHSPNVTLVRIDSDEAERLGSVLAEKTNAAKGLAAVVVPTKGFSSIDKKGQPFYNDQVDRVLVNSIKDNLHRKVKMIEVDAHINDETFVDEAIKILKSMMRFRSD
ncbi:hypothetical protein A3K79_03460 [Candidatus Bathyarchaeota archaeon RBG_13_46_16b]|nr:MAG: hypothetical protein A3K79_03460 [Candidatus Bathyarchaeota archaeon RBG_13_46_16b]